MEVKVNQNHLRKNNSMELQFRGIYEEEKEAIPILPAWAYSKEEIKKLLDQYVKDQRIFRLDTYNG